MSRVLSILLLCAALLYGCGGGGGTSGFSSGSSGGSAFINITSFNMSTPTISNGTTFDATWSVNYSSPSDLYWLEFHMNSQNSIPQNNSALTKHLYRNCSSSNPVFDCKQNGTIRCQVNTDYTGKLYTICNILNSTVSPTTHNIIFTGNGYAILKACIYNANMQEVCDQKSVQITVQ